MKRLGLLLGSGWAIFMVAYGVFLTGVAIAGLLGVTKIGSIPLNASFCTLVLWVIQGVVFVAWGIFLFLGFKDLKELIEWNNGR